LAGSIRSLARDGRNIWNHWSTATSDRMNRMQRIIEGAMGAPAW
jgi:hypothetical protein